jgi:Fic family protein
MYDTNWDLVDGETAHQIEVLNYANQVNVIEALVRLLLHKAPAPPEGGGCGNFPSQLAFKELHRAGTLFLLTKPGEYREGEVHVAAADGTVVHTPPTVPEVQERMDQFFQWLGARWPDKDAVYLAALCLWMINWIHPFKNGNGRTARGFAYACLSLKLGFVLPGSPTVIDLVMQNREEYQAALKAADIGFAAAGEPDLDAMSAFIGNLLVAQLSTVPAE